MQITGSSNRPVRSAMPLIVFLCLPVIVRADPAGSPLSPTNIFAPVSTPAHSIMGLSLFVLAVTAAIFTIVFSLLVYCVLKFGKPPDDDGREPPRFTAATRSNWHGPLFPFSSSWFYS